MAFVNQDMTAKGLDLLAKGVAGRQITFTKMVMGKGFLPTGQSVRDIEGAIEPVATLELTKIEALGSGRVRVSANFDNTGITEGFYYRELVLHALDPDIGEIAYCYGNADNLAEWIPPVGTPTVVEKTIDVITKIDTATNVVAELKSQLYAPLDEFEAHVENNENPHGVTRGQLGAASDDEFQKHKADKNNPHEVTIDQIGATDGKSLEVQLAEMQEAIKELSEIDTTPTGSIQMYGSLTPPEGWLLCNGQAINRDQYRKLYQVIGNTYGAGNGTTTFNVPNLVDRFPLGCNANLGGVGGVATNYIQRDSLPATAAVSTGISPINGIAWQYATGSGWKFAALNELGVDYGQPLTNMPPYLTLPFIIKT